MHENATDAIYTVLFTAQGIHSIQKQSLSVPLSWYNVSSYVFSSNGDHFAFTNSDSAVVNGYIYLFDFDRCNGQFSNTRIIPASQNGFLWGINFSPNGQYLYANTSSYVFQINVNTLQVDTVAIYDGF